MSTFKSGFCLMLLSLNQLLTNISYRSASKDDWLDRISCKLIRSISSKMIGLFKFPLKAWLAAMNVKVPMRLVKLLEVVFLLAFGNIHVSASYATPESCKPDVKGLDIIYGSNYEGCSKINKACLEILGLRKSRRKNYEFLISYLDAGCIAKFDPEDISYGNTFSKEHNLLIGMINTSEKAAVLHEGFCGNFRFFDLNARAISGIKKECFKKFVSGRKLFSSNSFAEVESIKASVRSIKASHFKLITTEALDYAFWMRDAILKYSSDEQVQLIHSYRDIRQLKKGIFVKGVFPNYSTENAKYLDFSRFPIHLDNPNLLSDLFKDYKKNESGTEEVNVLKIDTTKLTKSKIEMLKSSVLTDDITFVIGHMKACKYLNKKQLADACKFKIDYDCLKDALEFEGEGKEKDVPLFKYDPKIFIKEYDSDEEKFLPEDTDKKILKEQNALFAAILSGPNKDEIKSDLKAKFEAKIPGTCQRFESGILLSSSGNCADVTTACLDGAKMAGILSEITDSCIAKFNYDKVKDFKSWNEMLVNSGQAKVFSGIGGKDDSGSTVNGILCRQINLLFISIEAISGFSTECINALRLMNAEFLKNVDEDKIAKLNMNDLTFNDIKSLSNKQSQKLVYTDYKKLASILTGKDVESVGSGTVDFNLFPDKYSGNLAEALVADIKKSSFTIKTETAASGIARLPVDLFKDSDSLDKIKGKGHFASLKANQFSAIEEAKLCNKIDALSIVNMRILNRVISPECLLAAFKDSSGEDKLVIISRCCKDTEFFPTLDDSINSSCPSVPDKCQKFENVNSFMGVDSSDSVIYSNCDKMNATCLNEIQFSLSEFDKKCISKWKDASILASINLNKIINASEKFKAFTEVWAFDSGDFLFCGHENFNVFSFTADVIPGLSNYCLSKLNSKNFKSISSDLDNISKIKAIPTLTLAILTDEIFKNSTDEKFTTLTYKEADEVSLAKVLMNDLQAENYSKASNSALINMNRFPIVLPEKWDALKIAIKIAESVQLDDIRIEKFTKDQLVSEILSLIDEKQKCDKINKKELSEADFRSISFDCLQKVVGDLPADIETVADSHLKPILSKACEYSRLQSVGTKFAAALISNAEWITICKDLIASSEDSSEELKEPITNWDSDKRKNCDPERDMKGFTASELSFMTTDIWKELSGNCFVRAVGLETDAERKKLILKNMTKIQLEAIPKLTEEKDRENHLCTLIGQFKDQLEITEVKTSFDSICADKLYLNAVDNVIAAVGKLKDGDLKKMDKAEFTKFITESCQGLAGLKSKAQEIEVSKRLIEDSFPKCFYENLTADIFDTLGFKVGNFQEDLTEDQMKNFKIVTDLDKDKILAEWEKHICSRFNTPEDRKKFQKFNMYNVCTDELKASSATAVKSVFFAALVSILFALI